MYSWGNLLITTDAFISLGENLHIPIPLICSFGYYAVTIDIHVPVHALTFTNSFKTVTNILNSLNFLEAEDKTFINLFQTIRLLMLTPSLQN
jgi:hypothetical protein